MKVVRTTHLVDTEKPKAREQMKFFEVLLFEDEFTIMEFPL